jgi:DHA1 family tetracycline resistance protein-like MFS transporter
LKRAPGLGFIFVTLLVDILGVGIIIPILPKLIQSLAHGSVAHASRDYGWLLSLYGAMQFLFSPLLGALSDRFGRRPVLLLSLLFTGVDYVIMALAPSLPWLFVGRILSGITGASFTAASAYIADVSAPEERAQNFGLVGAAFGIGFIVGPALGGVLGQWGPRLPFWAAAGLAFANMIYGLVILPESLPKEHRRRLAWREANPVGALRVLGKYPIVWGLTGALAASGLALQCLQSTWVLWTTAKFAWDVRQVGLSLAAFGVLSLVFQAGLSRLWLPKLGERRAVLLGFAIGTVEYLGYALATQGWMVYAIMVAAGVSFFAGPATQGLLSRQVGPDEQGSLQGAVSSLSSLMGIIGPLIATALFAHFTAHNAHPKVPGAPFFLGSALEFLALLISLRALRIIPDPQDT